MCKPLILTLAFAPEDQARFEALRQRHFPAAYNHIPAHLTLFHHLPGDEADAVSHSVYLAASYRCRFPVHVDGLRSLGRGTAFTIASPILQELRTDLASFWHGSLTAQDRQGWRPHVTIQNKVRPGDAAALLAGMREVFTPFWVRADGLQLWTYQGGPWAFASYHPFTGAPKSAQPSVAEFSR